MKFKVGDKVKVLVEIRNPQGVLLDGTPQPAPGDIVTIVEVIPNAMMWPYKAVYQGAAIGFREDELASVSTMNPVPTINRIKALAQMIDDGEAFKGSPVQVPLIYHSVDPAYDKPESELKCECGVDSIGGGRHSSYCPKAPYN